MYTVATVHFTALSQCRDTFWVESFNHQLLSYLPKRIHFGTRTFVMRMYLAVMDWVNKEGGGVIFCTFCDLMFFLQNENTQRSYTSERFCPVLRRPDRHIASKVLVAKKFNFVRNVWQKYVAQCRYSLQ